MLQSYESLINTVRKRNEITIAKIRQGFEESGTNVFMFLRVIRRATARRYHPYIPSKTYAGTKVPNTWFKSRNNIPQITNVTTAVHDCVIDTTVKEIYLCGVLKHRSIQHNYAPFYLRYFCYNFRCK
jgi:hypothetical protein